MGITPWRTLESSWERRLHRPLEIGPVLHVLVAFMCQWDEALAFAAVDVSGRPFLAFRANFSQERTGEYDLCLTEEFMRAFATNAGITLHVRLEYGANAHHEAEAIFKAVAHALRLAATQTGEGVLSTKGSL